MPALGKKYLIPFIAWASVNLHNNSRRNPKSNVIVRSPYVEMLVPIAARSLYQIDLAGASALGGITLTLAPVSTRNSIPELLSLT